MGWRVRARMVPFPAHDGRHPLDPRRGAGRGLCPRRQTGARANGIGAYDAVQALFQFERTFVTFETCWIIPNSWPTVVDNRFTLYGAKGCIELEGTPGVRIASDRYKYPFSSHAMTRYGKPFAHFYESVRHFADCVAKDQPPQATGHDGLIATAMIQATIRALNEERAVKMSEVLG